MKRLMLLSLVALGGTAHAEKSYLIKSPKLTVTREITATREIERDRKPGWGRNKARIGADGKLITTTATKQGDSMVVDRTVQSVSGQVLSHKQHTVKTSP